MAQVIHKFLSGRWWLATVVCAAVAMVGVAALLSASPASSQPASAQVAPRATLDAYEWDELSRIAQEVAACSSAEQAVACGARYGLCDASGAPTSARKTLELADGTSVEVVLADLWCDERSDGGRAGLTFVFANCSVLHPMNHAYEDAEGDHADSTGGWEASDMRAWLCDTLWYELPASLRSSIVAVQKPTANAVDTTDELAAPGQLAGSAASWVSETSDRLWLLSASELCGSIPARDDLGVDETMSGIYQAEGAQYRLFADAGCTAFAPCEALVRCLGEPGAKEPVTWWLRTKTLEFDQGFWLVGTDGTPLNGLGDDVRVVGDASYAPSELWGPDHARGVVVGFCL